MTSPRGAAPIPDVDLSGRRVLASFHDYSEAQRAVDTLSDRQFDVSNVSIVGTGLQMVESVVGRLTTGRAAAAGAASGAWFGLFVGLLFSFYSNSVLGPLLVGLLLGAAFGAVGGALGHSAYRGQRDFASARTIIASRYDVLVKSEAYDAAARTLGGGSAPAAPVDGGQYPPA
ncbi:general stress protein [Jatrophihabitans sp. YIM 134969]